MKILIECLVAPGCGARQGTLDLVEKVATQLDLAPEVREIVIQTPDEAVQNRFLGSPSLRINGRDIEPGAELRTDFGLG